MSRDRLPPQNLEAERSCLGACIIENSKIDEVSLIVSPEDFYRDRHQIFCQAIFDIHESGKPVDGVILHEHFSTKGTIHEVGGYEGIAEIIESAPTSANATYWAAIVREKATKRGLIGIATELLKGAYSNETTSEEMLLDAEQSILKISERSFGSAIWTGDALAESSGVRLLARMEGQLDGIATGFADLDDMLGGLKPGQLIILAARPSMGKTGLALDILRNAAANGHPGLKFSIEMSHQELADRLVCSLAEIDSQKFQQPSLLSEAEKCRAFNAMGEIKGLKFFVDDAGSRTALQIAASSRRLSRQERLSLVIVDYLQLIGGTEGDSRQEQISAITRRLKTLARDMGMPFIVLSQLNREPEKRGDKRPQMSDLRESGAIEQDADVVLLIHRPSYYDPNEKPNIAEVIIAKNRNGPTGVIELQFDRRFVRFSNLSYQQPQHNGAAF